MRNFDNWLDQYMLHSSASEAPDIMHFWTGVSVIAGALRRKVWIDQKIFQWTPNFYIVFVAPPGVVNKSTTADIGMRLLKRVPDIHFGANSMTWQAMTEDLANATQKVEFKDRDDMKMSCLTIVASEFGSLLDPRDTAMVDVLVDLWDGKLDTWTRSTKTQGKDVIVNPWINLIACTTPAWISANFPDYLIGGGFTSRTIFIYRDTKRHLMAYPADAVETGYEATEKKLVEDLIYLSKMKGEMELTEEAKEWGRAWYEQHAKNCPEHLAGDRFAGYRARKQGQVHKLAMVISASRSNELVVTKEDLAKADTILTALEPDLPKVFSWIKANSEGDAINKICAKIKISGSITKANLFRSLMMEVGYMDLKNAIEVLQSSRHIVTKQKGRDIVYSLAGD